MAKAAVFSPARLASSVHESSNHARIQASCAVSRKLVEAAYSGYTGCLPRPISAGAEDKHVGGPFRVVDGPGNPPRSRPRSAGASSRKLDVKVDGPGNLPRSRPLSAGAIRQDSSRILSVNADGSRNPPRSRPLSAGVSSQKLDVNVGGRVMSAIPSSPPRPRPQSAGVFGRKSENLTEHSNMDGSANHPRIRPLSAGAIRQDSSRVIEKERLWISTALPTRGTRGEREISSTLPTNGWTTPSVSAISSKLHTGLPSCRPRSAPAGGRSLQRERKVGEPWDRLARGVALRWSKEAGGFLHVTPSPPGIDDVIGMDLNDLRRLTRQRSASHVLSDKLKMRCHEVGGTVLRKQPRQAVDRCIHVRAPNVVVREEEVQVDEESNISSVPTFASSFEGTAPPAAVASGIPKTSAVTHELLEWTEALLKEAAPPDIAPQGDDDSFEEAPDDSDVSAPDSEPRDSCDQLAPSSPTFSGKVLPSHTRESVETAFNWSIRSRSDTDGWAEEVTENNENTHRRASFAAHLHMQASVTALQALAALKLPPRKMARPSLVASAIHFQPMVHDLKVCEEDGEESESESSEEGSQDDEELNEVFSRVAQGKHVLDCAQFLYGLRLLGHWRPSRELVEQLPMGQCTLAKFGELVKEYEAKSQESMRTNFRIADTDASGKLGAAEISALLRRQSIAPVPGVVEGLIHDALDERGMKYTSAAELDFEGYFLMQELMRRRAGFSRTESERFLMVFARYDRDRDGKITRPELMAALSWVGSSMDATVVEALAKKVDPDDSGYLSEYNFLFVMQKIKQLEIKDMVTVFGEMDMDNSGTCDADELVAIFEAMGHICASPDLVTEVTETCGFSNQSELLFEQVFTLMEEVRKTEGYLQSELQMLTDVFHLYDFDDRLELGPVDIAKAMKHMGFPVTLEEMVDALVEFDFDKGGTLDFREFVKLTTRYRNAEMRSVRNLFQKHNMHYDGKVPFHELEGVLKELRYDDRDEYPKFVGRVCKGLEGKQVGLWQLADLVSQYRRERACKLLDQMFFHDYELAPIRKRFRKYELKRDHVVPFDQLPLLLYELHPDCRDRDSMVESLLKDFDRDVGSIDFQECLRLTRKAQDQVSRLLIEKVRLAVQKSAFTEDEVREIRRIFRTLDIDPEGEVSFASFAEWISCIVCVDNSTSAFEVNLRHCLRKIVDDETAFLDFAEMLLAMRALLDEDFLKIKLFLGFHVEEKIKEPVVNKKTRVSIKEPAVTKKTRVSHRAR